MNMTMITSNLTPALRATCRLSSIRRRGLVHKRLSAAQLYCPHQRAAVQPQPLLSPPSALDPQVRHNIGNIHNVITVVVWLSSFEKRLFCYVHIFSIFFLFLQTPPRTGAGAAVSLLLCLSTRMVISSIIHPCLTQDITVSRKKNSKCKCNTVS